jgi:hypothetical protein
MKLVAVQQDEIDDVLAAATRGSVSYPILKTFLESNMYMAQLDKSDMTQDYQSLLSSIGGYVRRHRIPVKMFARNGEVYFVRLDIDKHGNQIPDWDKDKKVAGAESKPIENVAKDMMRQQLLKQQGK